MLLRLPFYLHAATKGVRYHLFNPGGEPDMGDYCIVSDLPEELCFAMTDVLNYYGNAAPDNTGTTEG